MNVIEIMKATLAHIEANPHVLRFHNATVPRTDSEPACVLAHMGRFAGMHGFIANAVSKRLFNVEEDRFFRVLHESVKQFAPQQSNLDCARWIVRALGALIERIEAGEDVFSVADYFNKAVKFVTVMEFVGDGTPSVFCIYDISLDAYITIPKKQKPLGLPQSVKGIFTPHKAFEPVEG